MMVICCYCGSDLQKVVIAVNITSQITADDTRIIGWNTKVMSAIIPL